MKLNSLKTYNDKWILVCLGMIFAYFLMLLPLCWGRNEKAESETETAWTSEAEFPFTITTNTKFCEWEITQELRNIISWVQNEDWFRYLMLNAECDYEDERIERALEERNRNWYPWKLTEDWTEQEMPTVLTTNGSHEAFKDLANMYWLNASTIRTVENHYWLTEWMVLCVTIAETSWGNRWYGKTNPWNVGNNDRWDRVKYALFETWLEKIAQTLTNQYLGKIQTLACLSNAWNCQSRDDKWYRYATSDGSWEKNMASCLWKIYGKINPATFNIRNR